MIFPDNGKGRGEKGLILVTGATNSAKSEIIRALMWKHLVSSSNQSVKHVVTYEDPIEQRLYATPQGDPAQRCVDYTPRQKGPDCKSLREVLKAALRQTPEIVYIGEIRTNSEFRQTLAFGGTGHLVAATAHAGNVVEGMARLFSAVGAGDPGTRGIFVPKILAVIHLAAQPLHTVKIQDGRGGYRIMDFNFILPSMYRRTDSAMQALVADGLISLVPGISESACCLGRQYFAKALAAKKHDPSAKDKEAIDKLSVGERGLLTKLREACRKASSGAQRSLLTASLKEDLRGR